MNKICMKCKKENNTKYEACYYCIDKNRQQKHPLIKTSYFDEKSYGPDEIKEICLASVIKNVYSLEYIPLELKTKEICLAAVTQFGYSLQYVPEKIIDKEICLAAVTQFGYSLRYVPEKIIDKEICLVAVTQYGRSLKYVPEKIIDKEIYLAAVTKNKRSLKYVPKLIYKETECYICLSEVTKIIKDYCCQDICEECYNQTNKNKCLICGNKRTNYII